MHDELIKIRKVCLSYKFGFITDNGFEESYDSRLFNELIEFLFQNGGYKDYWLIWDLIKHRDQANLIIAKSIIENDKFKESDEMF